MYIALDKRGVCIKEKGLLKPIYTLKYSALENKHLHANLIKIH